MAPQVDGTRQRILEAAARAFAERGYAGATTRVLAEAAGVNEVTLFRHFGNKQSLFTAVIEQYAAPALSTAIAAELTGDYRHDLVAMGTPVLAALLERREALRLVLCEAWAFPEVREALAQNPIRLRGMLASYLRRQMALGRVRPLHAEAAAQAFWGMLFAYVVSLWLTGKPVDPAIGPEELVREFVDIFVAGTANRGGEHGV